MASPAQRTLVGFFYNLDPENFKGDPNYWLNLPEDHSAWADFDAAASKAGQKLYRKVKYLPLDYRPVASDGLSEAQVKAIIDGAEVVGKVHLD